MKSKMRVVLAALMVCAMVMGMTATAYAAAPDPELNEWGRIAKVSLSVEDMTAGDSFDKEDIKEYSDNYKIESGSVEIKVNGTEVTGSKTLACSNNVTVTLKVKATNNKEFSKLSNIEVKVNGKTDNVEIKEKRSDYVKVKYSFVVNHKEMIVDAEEPTCTEPGHTAGKKCSVCNTTLEGLVEIPASHDFTEVEELPAVHTPKELKAGVAAHYQCSVCDGLFKDKDDESGEKVETTLKELTGERPEHSFGEWVNTNPEKHWKECACGKKDYEGVHVYDNDKDTTCNDCGYVRTIVEKEDAPKTGDEANMMVWLILMAMAAAVGAVSYKRRDVK